MPFTVITGGVRPGSFAELWRALEDSHRRLAEAQPYYVDDSCFDDGTGNDPGPRVIPRSDHAPMRAAWS